MNWKASLPLLSWTGWALSLAWFVVWLGMDYFDLMNRPDLYAYGGLILIATTVLLVVRMQRELGTVKKQLSDKQRRQSLLDHFSNRLKEGEDLQRRKIEDDREQYLKWKAEYQEWYDTVYSELKEKLTSSDAIEFYSLSDLPARKEFAYDPEFYMSYDYNTDLNVLDRYLVNLRGIIVRLRTADGGL